MNSLEQLLKEDVGFRKEMQRLDAAYEKERQLVLYTEVKGISPNLLRHAGQDERGNQLFFVFGMLQSNNMVRMMYMHIRQWLEERLPVKYVQMLCRGEGFVIVYFNSNADSYTSYSTFRNIYRSFPLKYFLGLRAVLVVHPSFAIKALDWMVSGPLNTYLRDNTHYVSTLPQLKDYGIPLNKEVMDCIRQDIRCIDFPKGFHPEGKRVPKTKQRLFTEAVELSDNLHEEPKKPKPICLLNKFLYEYETSDIGVPILLKMMVMYLEMRPDFLCEEGIFRKSVAIDEEEQAMSELFSGNYNYLQSISNPHIVASLIKKMLGSLKEPLFPYQAYGKLTNDSGQNSDPMYLKEVVDSLPRDHYVTLMFLLRFFLESVIRNSAKNKMNHYNVAVVLLPSLMRSPNNTIEDLMYSKKLVLVLQSILKNFSAIFGAPSQQENLYEQNSRKSQKEFTREFTLELDN